jgi:hypothetical protein
MKTIQTLIIAILIVALACDKDEEVCVKKAFFDSGVETLTKTDRIKAESLFFENNLNYENKQFTLLTENDLNIIVKGYQYVNGLKVFTEPLTYFFRKSFPQRLDFLLGDTLLPASIELGTSHQMESNAAFTFYRSIIEADKEIHWNSSRCYVVEFGYYDLNVSTKQDQVYVPAWRIKPEGGTVPIVYINDITKDLIYYDNGIRQ